MTSDTPENGAYLNALYTALEGDGTAVRDADPLDQLRRIVAGARAVVGDEDVPLIEALAAVADAASLEQAIVAAEAYMPSAEALLEAVYAARCLERDGAAAFALLRSRAYVSEASVPEAIADLSTDRTAVLDATSFYALWRQPGRVEWMLDLLARWRRDYVATYAARHDAHQAELSAAVDEIYASAAAARAVEKLNSISRLGVPLGVEAVEEMRALQDTWACDVSGTWLIEALAESPVCAMCGYRLGDVVPGSEAKRTRAAIERALAGQQARLARHVVSRILARPSDGETQRLQRFIEVVQASDLSGLAVVLDDELLAFIQALLQGESAPSTVLARLADAYPEVSAGNLDAAVEELRRLLSQELSQAETVRLDAAT